MGLDWHKWDSDRHRLAWGRWCSWVAMVFLAMGCRESWDWWLWQKMDLIWFIYFIIIWVCGYGFGSGGGSGGGWFGFLIWNLDFFFWCFEF